MREMRQCQASSHTAVAMVTGHPGNKKDKLKHHLKMKKRQKDLAVGGGNGGWKVMVVWG